MSVDSAIVGGILSNYVATPRLLVLTMPLKGIFVTLDSAEFLSSPARIRTPEQSFLCFVMNR